MVMDEAVGMGLPGRVYCEGSDGRSELDVK
jgi:hypothetical protein